MFRIAAGLVVAITSVVIAADPPKPADAPKDLDGYRKPLSVVYDGKEMFEKGVSRDAVALNITEGEYRMYYVAGQPKGMGVRLVTAGLTLDPKTKTLELTIKDGQNKGLKCHGIYDLADGKLKLCYGPVSVPRPTTFAAPEKSGLFCETWVTGK